MASYRSRAHEVIGPFRAKHAFLSNFEPAPVVLDHVQYPTVEHAYQAAKTLEPALREFVRSAPTPGEAKRRGATLVMRPDWEQVRVAVMTSLVEQKFEAEDLQAKLLATGDTPIVEINDWGDTFWGVYEGVGENWLGRILQRVRNRLREDARQEVG